MAERQQDLIRNQAGTSRENLSSGEFFSRLSLADIYGQYTLKPGTTIVTDIPNDANFDLTLFSDPKRLRELADRYGIPSIGSGSYGGLGTKWQKPFVEISAGMGSPMTAWAPYVFERGTIMALAHSLSGSKKPLILDVGCGNGFTSKLLAVEGDVTVLGVDPDFSQYDQLPATSGDVEFRETDIVDLIGELGPKRSPETSDRVYEIIRKLTDRLKGKENLHFWGMQHGFSMSGDGWKFEDEVRELQELSESNLKTSPVDLVICSFMRTGTDLTPAIRDGIHPRAIIYVRPTNGLSGIGSYYDDSLEVEDHEEEFDQVASFNPGRNYRTVARWQTFWQDDWTRVAYNLSGRPGERIGIEPAEVVIQVHKDTDLKKPEVSTVRTYGWDDEIAKIVSDFRRYNQHKTEYKTKDGFFLGMKRLALLPEGRSELTPPR